MRFPPIRSLLAWTVLTSCAAEPVAGPTWLDLEDAPPHEIVEVSGASGGQLVIVVPSGSSQADVLELGRRIADQAPPNATLNARIFDDLDTARNWRTAPADWTVQHLLVVVTGTPESDEVDVRWMRPEEESSMGAPDATPVDSLPEPSASDSAPPPGGGL